MNVLFLLNEITTNGYNIALLDLISLFSIICGILVIISKNPIVSVLFLIGLFFSLASYLIILGISFIGLSYLLVYVGAVSILFLFILMLINVRISELLSDTSNVIPLAILSAMYFIYTVYQLLPYNHTALYAKNISLNLSLESLNNFINKGLNYSNVAFTAQDKGPIMFVTAAL